MPPDFPTTTPLLTANISHSQSREHACFIISTRVYIHHAPPAADWNLEESAMSAMENLAPAAGGRRHRFICRCLSVRKPCPLGCVPQPEFICINLPALQGVHSPPTLTSSSHSRLQSRYRCCRCEVKSGCLTLSQACYVCRLTADWPGPGTVNNIAENNLLSSSTYR